MHSSRRSFCFGVPPSVPICEWSSTEKRFSRVVVAPMSDRASLQRLKAHERRKTRRNDSAEPMIDSARGSAATSGQPCVSLGNALGSSAQKR